MENFVTLIIPALLSFLLIRCLFYPMKLIFKIGIHSACGFVCLWLLNTVSGFTGVYLPINAATVLIAGIFGVPGMGLIALLELM